MSLIALPLLLGALALGLGLGLGSTGCDPKDDDDLPKAGVACSSLSPSPAIVTDIDETLTTSDEEFIQQMLEPDYVPAMRPGSLELVKALYKRGYLVMYLTARAETLELMDGTSGREATEGWLVDMGFPMDPDRTEVVLAPSSLVGDEEGTAAYKRDAILDRVAAGWTFDFAFGNATTDASGYLEAGIPPDQIYMIGDHAGYQGTVAVQGEGWTTLIETELAPLPRVCDF
jgi:phosphatidate phosphatase PAH1